MMRQRQAHDADTKRLFQQALEGMSIASLIPESMLDDVVNAIQLAGELRGETEAYDHYMQTRAIKTSKREKRLGQQCHLLLANMERLLRVNRFLFNLLAEKNRRHRANDHALEVFTTEGRRYSRGGGYSKGGVGGKERGKGM